MSEIYVEDAPAVSLPCPLPARYPTEPRELTVYRREPGNDKEFMKLRRTFRDAEDWRALATLLALHAATIGQAEKTRGKAAELCIQSYELWLERVKDRESAAHALARAVLLRPDNKRAQDRLRKLYETLGSHKELVALLRWRLRATPTASDAAALHFELAELLEHHFLAVGEAVQHYEQALQLDPSSSQAIERLIRLYLSAGAWSRAAQLIEHEIVGLEQGGDRTKLAALHRTLATIESEHLHNVAGAARHLQAALKFVPDDIEALRAFGVLYLSSGKATEDGVAKAADIFYKAAELARRRGDKRRALKLLRRSLALAPDHQQASAALENTLIDAEDWLALDDLYREWLFHFAGPDAVPLLLRRADLLDARLYRREEARQLYEEASRYQKPDEESWRRLEQIYTESGDHHALASLLDAQVERMPDEVSTQTLLRAAAVYRDELGLEERAAVYYYKVLEREPFNAVAFEGYKEHWRRKHNWAHLRDLVLYQIEQASTYPEHQTPLADPAFAEEFVELADICERRLGDIDGAMDAWGRLSAAYPADPRPDKNIARIEKRARMWDNMVRVQEAELERTVDPRKRLDILKRLTQVYRDRQVNPDRAIELYNEILHLSPADIQATRALTALYDRAGDFPQVVEMLREQYEHSRSNTERISLLRRMAELWHHELDAPAEAIWACEQILEHAPADREALYRLEQILEEQEQWDVLYETLQRELKHAGSVENKVKILRRMARLAEHELADEDRAAGIWVELHGLRPHELEIVDKLIAGYERTGRYEESATLLTKAAADSRTALVRQVDYLLRLGQLAESQLDDPELARSSFENVLRSRPDHRGALEALVRLYRRADAWQPLVAILGKLQELAETDDDAFRIAWERAEILGDQLGDAEGAAEILEGLAEGPAQGRPEVQSTLLDLYERSRQYRKLVRQAELMLLASTAIEERRRLYRIVSDTWHDKLGDKRAALSAYARYIDEFSDDLDGLWTLSDLYLEVDDHEAALRTLQRRLDLALDVPTQLGTLVHMADIAEGKLSDGARALEFLRRALAVDHFNADIIDRIRRTAETHQLWQAWLRIDEERAGYHAQAGDADGRIEVCTEAATIAEERVSDPGHAFDWSRRGYFVAMENDRDGRPLLERLEHLAEQHGMWADLLAVIDREIGFYEERGSVADGSYDAVARYLAASEVAEERLKDPERAVELLQKAHRLRPEDEGLADRLEASARRYSLWPAVIELYGGRLKRADTSLGRYDACRAIARVYEDELDDPEKAFEWIQKAHLDLRAEDPKLAEDAYEELALIVERHRLWAQLCEHHLARAREAGETGDQARRLGALREATTIFEERLEDPLAALRTLAAGIEHDPGGDTLLPDIRRLSEAVDAKRDGTLPAIGTLMLLDVLQRLCEQAESDIDRQQLVEERARVREERLGDYRGAMAEWLRVLQLDPESDQALVELERIADEADLWSLFLLLPAWQLEQTSEADEQATLYRRLARIYEGPLERSEYALRARLAAWRLEPRLPQLDEELDEENAAIWRLAADTGPYHTPPVPKDPLLRPAIAVPEAIDQERWLRVGLDPRALEAIPSPYSPPIELGAPVAIPTGMTEDISLTELAEQVTDEEDDEDDEDDADLYLEDDAIEELDLEELEDLVEIVEEPTLARAGDPTTVEATASRAPAPPPPRPPPPPRAPDAGLPALPRLARPVLPARPRVASAWEEVALVYADYPTTGKQAQADVALVLARLWEEGAGNLERAFTAYEQALLWVPEYEVALHKLQDLAERHAVVDRLLMAYQRLLGEAAMPEHVVEMGLRIARLHESREELREAERSYRGVLSVIPNHAEALEALCRIYDAQERHGDYVEAYAEALEAQTTELDDDALVERTLELARLLADRVNRRKEAIERLELLVRQFPHRREPHEALIDLLIAARQWQQAIDAMRTGSDAVDDDDFRRQSLTRVAEIYEQRLGLPDRAIAALAELADLPGVGDDDALLGRLQELYLETSRYEPALPIIERRLALLDDDPSVRPQRISLLVAKARVLQEGLGDEAAATETLEQLVAQAPDNDEVVMGLSRLYRKVGRLDDGIELLRERWTSVDPSERERYVPLTRSLAETLDREGHDPKGALEVTEQALATYPTDPVLLRTRATLARALHDLPLLARSLAELSDPDALLEAADLMRGPVRDTARAVRLYSRVLAESKKNPDDPESSRRLASALEGLVKLRVEDGDIRGAMEFMDKQLAEVSGPTIRAQLLTEMGRITYRSTQDVEAAGKRFDAALEEDPEYARAKLGKAEVLIEAGAAEDAQSLLEDAIDALALAPAHHQELVEGLVLLARVLEEAGRSGEAYRRLTTAARHDPDNLEIRAAIVRNRMGSQRWRDAVTAAEQVEQQLAEGIERTPKQVRLISEIFVQAAAAEVAMGLGDKALARYRRAAEVDPGNAAALEPLISLCQERGALVEAARQAEVLARQTDDDGLRGQRYVEAGMLFHDAAQALADGAEPVGDETEADLRKAAFENLRLGLELVEGHQRALDPAILEVAFRASADHDPRTALDCLDNLLQSNELPPARRHDLLLEGVRIGLNADELEAAERHAKAARELSPHSAPAVLAQARVLEATDRLEEIESLVEGYFTHLPRAPAGDEDVATRVELLLRLAELQRAHPNKAIAALERAADLDPSALGPTDRKQLAGLYADAGIDEPRVLENHLALLVQEPLHAPSLAAIAAHFAESGNLDRAHAVYQVLSIVEPHDQAARWFLEGHEVEASGSGELAVEPFVLPPEADAGIGEALELLLEGGGNVLWEHLPRVDVPPDARISPLGDSALAQIWGEMLKRLGQSKVALVDASAVALDPAQTPDVSAGEGLFEVRCQHPPIVLVHEAATRSEDPDELKFALGRALYFTRSSAVFATGVRRATLAELLSATLQAFHPRHSRRKHHQRGDDPVGKLSGELARKLPMRVSRQLGNLFKEHESEAFDSRLWRSRLRRNGNRVGLVLAGRLDPALRLMLGPAWDDPDSLQGRVAADLDLRDLVAFAASAEFSQARRDLGFAVKPK